MGVWGPGLYANDLGKDLKATITSVLRLPFEADNIVKLLQESFPAQSSRGDDEDYTSFWLIVADQLHKNGVKHAATVQRACEIIDSGMDLNCPERQEFSPADRRKREKVLQDLREQISNPPPTKVRKTLSKPQPLLMRPGEVFAFPVYSHNNPANPHSPRWSYPQEKWGAFCIVANSLVFDYLAVYYFVRADDYFALDHKPALHDVLQQVNLKLRRPGTCSKIHSARMKLEKIGEIQIDPQQVVKKFPEWRDGRYQAINDISIFQGMLFKEFDGQIGSLQEITQE